MSQGFQQGLGYNATSPPSSGLVLQQEFASPNAPGNLLFAACGWYGGSATASIADTAGNTANYVQLPTLYYPTYGLGVTGFYVLNCANYALRNTITVTLTSTLVLWNAFYVSEFSGVDTAGPTATSENSLPTVTTTKTSVLIGYNQIYGGNANAQVTGSWNAISAPTNSLGLCEWQANVAAGVQTLGLSPTSPGVLQFATFYTTHVPPPPATGGNLLMMTGCGT